MKSACLDYGYNDDDILIDVISSFSVIGCGVGEILGSLYSGFLAEIIGIENCCTIIAIASLIFAMVFAIGTGVVSEWFEKKPIKNEIFINSEPIN